MDPLPFLFTSVLLFGTLQLGTYLYWHSTRPKERIPGINKVKAKDFIANKIPKVSRKK